MLISSTLSLNISDKGAKSTDAKELIQNAKRSNPATLAFLGDAVYELYIRRRLTADGSRQADTLHKAAIQFVCASAQAKVFDSFLSILSEDELDILRRGRNAKTARVPKHSSVADYRKATALETLFGYLSLSKQEERLEELCDKAFEIISKG